MTPIWTTKDGEKMPLGEMSDQHVINAHRMMLGKVSTLGRVNCAELPERHVELIVLLDDARRWVRLLDGEMKRRLIQ